MTQNPAQAMQKLSKFEDLKCPNINMAALKIFELRVLWRGLSRVLNREWYTSRIVCFLMLGLPRLLLCQSVSLEETYHVVIDLPAEVHFSRSIEPSLKIYGDDITTHRINVKKHNHTLYIQAPIDPKSLPTSYFFLDISLDLPNVETIEMRGTSSLFIENLDWPLQVDLKEKARGFLSLNYDQTSLRLSGLASCHIGGQTHLLRATLSGKSYLNTWRLTSKKNIITAENNPTFYVKPEELLIVSGTPHGFYFPEKHLTIESKTRLTPIEHPFSFAQDLETYHNTRQWISQDLWELVDPYLLPYEHPLREALDALFSTRPSHSRITKNIEDWKRTFDWILPGTSLVAKDARFPGILLKTYQDGLENIGQGPLVPRRVSHHDLLQRMRGIQVITKVLEENPRLGDLITTSPQKWLYPLPKDLPLSQHDYLRYKTEHGASETNFLLIAEEKAIEGFFPNRGRYSSLEYPAQVKLKEFMRLLKLYDKSVRNLCYDVIEKKWMLIDTESIRNIS